LAGFGDQEHAAALGGRDRAACDALSGHRHRAGAATRGTIDGVRDLTAASADEAGKPDDLTGSNREGNTVHSRGDESVDLEHHVCVGCDIRLVGEYRAE